MSTITYRSAGVDYDPLDAFKRYCQKSAGTTVGNLARLGFGEPAGIRGETAYLLETDDAYLAHVEEGLGTKVLVADAMYRLTGQSFYRNIAIDNIATIANDLCACGALPVSMAMFAAVGDTAYLADARRSEDLAAGFAEGCEACGAVWGGGETQVLKGIVSPETMVLGGSAFGQIRPKHLRITGDVRDGDAIVCLASSGVQTNGLTLCRAVAERLPEGYLTKLSDGRTYGEALLDASIIYVRFVAECQSRNIPLHYAVHVTGHGWRKFMRLEAPFVYRISRIRPPQPVFDCIAKAAGLDHREAYGTFNMGVGFAVYVAPEHAEAAVACAGECGYEAWLAGRVCREGDRKAVIIEPLGLEFGAETLAIR
ncbi:MAG TPA: AIR synthase related protein [Phycisphaerae bacterium]|nr:AIR synthase related protein [Phycisphaerae bacterium]HOJ73973.1 AIR synthase related protein [Phycisphaerae bacterium]HOM50914.1 AIR synthase related protein [Phycisphaerae bacterium]HOQ85601.1 AIR synthase related protein [Phycisphaerae bacterium]HPP25911.1 AIR synthase related protein [Phycisphaerae bacterium]